MTESKQDDSSSSRKQFEDIGKKLDRNLSGLSKKVEVEAQRIIAYLNDEVVPAIRVNSSKGLREAAEQLKKLADSMEQHPGGPGEKK